MLVIFGKERKLINWVDFAPLIKIPKSTENQKIPSKTLKFIISPKTAIANTFFQHEFYKLTTV
jgi:hypothetical protein